MDTMNIALPENLKLFVQNQVEIGSYSSASEYIRELIRKDQKERAREALEIEILKGLDSGEAMPMTADDWQVIREEVKKRYAKRMQQA